MADRADSGAYSAWRSAFEASLRGADEDRVLARHYPGELVVSVLQARDTRVHGSPGSGDFRRGLSHDASGWLVGQRWHVDGSAQRIDALVSDMDAGTQAWQFEQSAASQDDLRRSLDTIGTRAAIDLCGDTAFAARVLACNPVTCININHDPFAQALTSGQSVDGDAFQDTLSSLLDRAHGNAPGHRLLACHGARYHASGASDVFELALMFSTFVAWLRALESASLSVADCAALTVLRPAVGSDLVLNVAKLRALRAGIASICTHCGDAQAAGQVRVHAQPATREMARTGPWVNTLRTTAATAAAALGGAQTVFTVPHDGADSAASRRLARNTQLILREESGLHRVQDPSGGAGQFETLTDQLLERAWHAFQALESAGGIAAAINNGSVSRAVSEHGGALLRDVRTRRRVLTGVNLYPDPLGARGLAPGCASSGDIACAPITLSAPFDALRAGAGDAPPVIGLVPLSTAAHTAQRIAFCRNLLAAGGLDASTDPGTAGRVVILCGTDADYAEAAPDGLESALARGATRVYLAGTPDDLAEPLLDRGAHSVIRAGLDAVAFLEDLHGHLGLA